MCNYEQFRSLWYRLNARTGYLGGLFVGNWVYALPHSAKLDLLWCLGHVKNFASRPHYLVYSASFLRSIFVKIDGLEVTLVCKFHLPLCVLVLQ